MTLHTPPEFLAALAAEGCKVEFPVANWTQPDRPGPWDPHCVVNHHTGPPASLTWDHAHCRAYAAGTLHQGRSDLPGPLCTVGICRHGVVMPTGWWDTNNAGYGDPAVLAAVIADRPIPSPPGPDSTTADFNAASYAAECMHPGDSTPWPTPMVDALARFDTAVCRMHQWTHNSVIGHKELTRRKSDPYPLRMADVRTQVRARLQFPPSTGTEPAVAFMDDKYAADVAWRVDAIANLRPTFLGGSQKGQKVPLTAALTELQAEVKALADAGSPDAAAVAKAVAALQGKALTTAAGS